MADIASLGIRADSSEVDKASQSLDSLSNAAKRAEAAANGVSSGMENASRASRDMVAQQGLLSRALSLISGLFQGNAQAAKAATSAHEANGKAVGLNSVQMMEFTHIARSMFEQIAAGQSPVRALALEFGRLQTAFTFNNSFLGTLRAILPILLPIAAAAAAIGVAFSAFTSKLNEGQAKTVDFFHTFEATAQVAWQAFTSQFGDAPQWFSDLWSRIGDIAAFAINKMIQGIAIFGARIDLLLKTLPDLFQIGFNDAANFAIGALNKTTDAINGTIRALQRMQGQAVAEPTQAQIDATHIPMLGGASGAQADFMKAYGDYQSRVAQINSTDYIGQIRSQALKDMAGDMKNGADAAKKLAKDGFGALRDAARAAAQEISFYRQTFSGFFTTISGDLRQGKGVWASFADAANQALGSIEDHLLQLAANKVFDSLLGNFFSGGTAGFGGFGNDVGPGATFKGLQTFLASAKGNVFAGPGINAYANQVVAQPTFFRFANGGVMGEAGPEAIMPLRRGPDGRLGVSAPANQNAVHVTVGVSVDEDGRLQAYVKNISQSTTQQSIDAYDATMPEKVHRKAIRAASRQPGAVDRWAS